MDPGERKGWSEIISAADIDRHMAENGQAQVIAELLYEMLQSVPVMKPGKILFAGAGTGQLIDYVSLEPLADVTVVFSDLTDRFRPRLEQRLAPFRTLHWQWKQDDIERTQLSGPFDAVMISMVLQHVEWTRAIDSIVSLTPKIIYVVEQRNDRGGHAVTKSRELAPSIRTFAEVANPALVPESQLTEKLNGAGFVKMLHLERPVPDDKTLFGLVYNRQANS